MEETLRQKRVAKLIQKDLGAVFLKEGKDIVNSLGAMVSITVVRISSDLSVSKVYLSVFPFDKGSAMVAKCNENAWFFRKIFASKVKEQLRIIPHINFYLDDSMEYAEGIEKILNGLKKEE